MKILLTTFALFFSTPSFATAPRQFLVDLKVYMDGKLISHPRIMLNAGTKGEISELNEKTGKGKFMEVTAHAVPDAADQTFLQLVIGKFENGKKIVVGTPQLSAMLKEESVMEIEEDGKQLYKVAAIVYPGDSAPPATGKKKRTKK